jgi:trimeric autotransporter adhesin
MFASYLKRYAPKIYKKLKKPCIMKNVYLILFLLLGGFYFNSYGQTITVTGTSATAVCQGSSITVNFTVTNGSGGPRRFKTNTNYSFVLLSGTTVVATLAQGVTFGNAPLDSNGAVASYSQSLTLPSNTSGSNYAISVQSSGPNSSGNSGSINITVPPSAGTLSGIQSICSNGTTTFTTNGTSGGAWSSSNINIATINSSTGVVTGVAAGTATMTYTVTGTGGCANATAIRTVTVTAAPSAGSLSGTQEICVSGTTTFGSSVSGGSWSSSNAAVATINSSTGVVTGVAAGTATMTYTVTGTGGCANATANRTLTVSSCIKIWTGTVSSEWQTAGNWSNNAVPNNQTNVIIPATSNQPVVSGSTVRVAGSITIENGGVLTISSNSGLEVTNNISVAEGGEFIVSNKANLGQVNPNAVNTGIVKVRRNTMELSRLDYVLWSSPTQGTQTLKQFSPQTVNNRFYIYNPSTNQYNAVGSVHTPFESGKGYLIRTPNNHSDAPTVWSTEFQGTPNNGTVVQQMPAPRSGNQNRFFLVGNPYASAINIQAFLDVNDDNITGITYIWRKTNGTNISAYGVLNRNSNGTLNFTSNGKAQDPGNCIASGQGFIVEMKEGASEVVFTNVMRVCNGFGVLNRMIQETNSAMESDAMQLKLTQENGQFTFASLGYYANASNDFEESYDAQAMGDGTLSLATALEDKRLVSQSRAAFTTSDVVPLSIQTPAAGNYTISLDQFSGVFQNQVIFLEDMQEEVRHNLSSAPFVVALSGGLHDNRFRLVFQNQLLSVDTPSMNQDEIQIAIQQQTLYVRTTATEGISKVTVIDLQGRIITQSEVGGATEATVHVPQLRQQAALVKIENASGTIVYRKIML